MSFALVCQYTVSKGIILPIYLSFILGLISILYTNLNILTHGKMMQLSKITKEDLSLSTARLKISLMTNDDRANFKLLQTDIELMEFIGSIPSEKELKEKFEQRIDPWEKNEFQWQSLIVKDKITNTFIGSISFKLDSIEFERAEMGYMMLKEHHGKGYTTEACTALITCLFDILQVRKIISRCKVENIGSWKVMEKLGLKREGCFEMHSQANGIWGDDYSYGLVNPKVY